MSHQVQTKVDLTSLVLLALFNGESYGLKLKADLSAVTASVNHGPIYTVLSKLVYQGWATTRKVQVNGGRRGGRPRKMYALTEEGKAQAQSVRMVLESMINVSKPLG